MTGCDVSRGSGALSALCCTCVPSTFAETVSGMMSETLDSGTE